MSSETNSDTLRERLEHTQGKTRSALPWKNTAKERGNVAEDAIEYAAQLEHALKKKRGAFHQAAQAAQRRGDERDEARADRDRLHDALEEKLVQPVEVGPGRGTNICSRCDGQSALASNIEHAEGCPLREVERGDTVDKIRREAKQEAFREAADKAYKEVMAIHGDLEASDVAHAIRALSEGDDQEGS